MRTPSGVIKNGWLANRHRNGGFMHGIHHLSDWSMASIARHVNDDTLRRVNQPSNPMTPSFSLGFPMVFLWFSYGLWMFYICFHWAHRLHDTAGNGDLWPIQASELV